MEFEHGLNKSYQYGCRCNECRKAHTEVNRKYGRSLEPRKTRWDKTGLETLVPQCKSLAEVLSKLGIFATGNNYSVLKKKLGEYGISTEHFLGKRWNTGGCKGGKSLELHEIGPNTSRGSIKRCLLKNGILSYACAICGIDSWRGAVLSLRLDHINGVNNDNSIENLRLLCPNCDSQLDTFCGRNIKTT